MNVTPFQDISERYDLINDLISMGLHRRWKKDLIRTAFAHGTIPIRNIIDVSTGTGDVGHRVFKQASPSAFVIGLDPCNEMLRVAKPKISFPLVQNSAEDISLKNGSVDLLTCAFGVRNFSDRTRAFQEWHRVLAPQAIAAILEIHPVPSSWYGAILSLYWKHVVPQLGRLLADRSAYAYLRQSTQAFLTASQLVDEATKEGFSLVESRSLFGHGMVSLIVLENHA